MYYNVLQLRGPARVLIRAQAYSSGGQFLGQALEIARNSMGLNSLRADFGREVGLFIPVGYI